MRTGSEVLVSNLIAQGVRRVFIIPGKGGGCQTLLTQELARDVADRSAAGLPLLLRAVRRLQEACTNMACAKEG